MYAHVCVYTYTNKQAQCAHTQLVFHQCKLKSATELLREVKGTSKFSLFSQSIKTQKTQGKILSGVGEFKSWFYS